MSRIVIITFVTTALILVNYAKGACVKTERKADFFSAKRTKEVTWSVRCEGGDITDLDDVPNKPVVHLLISNRTIQIINNDTFSSFKKELTILKCTYCQIENIQSDSFRNFTVLTVLRLSNNRLRTLNASWLQNLERSLKELDLSYNKIEYIEDKAFDHLCKLEDLNIAHNKIKTLKFDMINRMKKLHYLDLSNNAGFNSFNDIFQFFRDDRNLNMHWSNNNKPCFAIKGRGGYLLEYSCQPRNITDLTADPRKVEILRVFDVNIPLLTNETFSDFSSDLSELVCLDCEIRNVQTNALSRFPNLNRINFWKNKLKSLNASFLQGIEGLVELKLSYNEISNIDDKVFDHLTKVEELYLNNNQLECLNVTAMSPMKRLRLLDLRKNPNFNCTSAVSQFLTRQGGELKI